MHAAGVGRRAVAASRAARAQGCAAGPGPRWLARVPAARRPPHTGPVRRPRDRRPGPVKPSRPVCPPAYSRAMRDMTLPVGDGFADLADARGVTPEELAEQALDRFLVVETSFVRQQAMRLALRHQSLLRRLGE